MPPPRSRFVATDSLIFIYFLLRPVCRWQDGSNRADTFNCVVAAQDGSFVLGGGTQASWRGNTNAGYTDFAAVKLDADGNELWVWQVRARGGGAGGKKKRHISSLNVTVAHDGSLLCAIDDDGVIQGMSQSARALRTSSTGSSRTRMPEFVEELPPQHCSTSLPLLHRPIDPVLPLLHQSLDVRRRMNREKGPTD